MEQKVNPVGIRLGISGGAQHTSKWYANHDYADKLNADLKARAFLEKNLAQAAPGLIRIERAGNNAIVTIHAARPGSVIGKGGDAVAQLKTKVSRILNVPVHINIEEIRKPEIEAKLVAQSIAQQLENRVMFRRAMKRAVSNAMKSGAIGIQIRVSGRLGGAEIARSEWCREGRVPLHTFKANIDYGIARANTTYGVIGVKIWIHKPEVQNKTDNESK